MAQIAQISARDRAHLITSVVFNLQQNAIFDNWQLRQIGGAMLDQLFPARDAALRAGAAACIDRVIDDEEGCYGALGSFAL